MLAYTVGFGGSMIWFGSSAGVAICNRFPEAKHTGRWVKEGWHVAVAYVLGFGIFLLVDGWKPYDVEVHKANPLISPTVGGAVAGGVFVFAVLVGLRHWVLTSYPPTGPLHVPHVHLPHPHLSRPHLPRREKTAAAGEPDRSRSGRPDRNRAPGSRRGTVG